MEKKETYKAPEMRSVVLIKEGVMQADSYHQGGGGSYGNEDTNDNGEY